MSQMYSITVTANGEVRDAEGNLLSSEPYETTVTVTEEEMLLIKKKIEGEGQ